MLRLGAHRLCVVCLQLTTTVRAWGAAAGCSPSVCGVLAADDNSEGLGCCGWVLTLFSWIIVVITFPLSLCVCMKVSKTFPLSLCVCMKVSKTFPLSLCVCMKVNETHQLFPRTSFC